MMGAAGYTAFDALFYVAAHHTSALNLSIIQGAIPALVLIGARVFLGVRFTALQALGALITMIGVGVIAAQGDLARLAALAFNSGDVMMVVAAVIYAGYTSAFASGRTFRERACWRPWRSPPLSLPCP